MQLVNYYTDHGHRTAIIKSVGRKWTRLYLIGETRVLRVPNSEARWFTPLGEVSPKQIRTFNAACRARGGKRGYVQ